MRKYAHAKEGGLGVNRFKLTAGVTLVETTVALMVTMIGLAGLFATSGQSYALLRRSKEVVTVRENILSRLDGIRTLSFSQLGKSSYLSSTLMVSGTAGDPSPYVNGMTGMKNVTETLTVYALGAHLFSTDQARADATPDYSGEFASQIDTVAPAAPKTYKAGSTAKGDWTLQVANSLPYLKVTRTGVGAAALVTVNNAGDVTAYPQLRVDVTFTWRDSSNVTRTQMASTIVSQSGSLQ